MTTFRPVLPAAATAAATRRLRSSRTRTRAGAPSVYRMLAGLPMRARSDLATR